MTFILKLEYMHIHIYIYYTYILHYIFFTFISSILQIMKIMKKHDVGNLIEIYVHVFAKKVHTVIY